MHKLKFMATSIVISTSNLETFATHVKSGKEIITDAPVDNNGKGSAFSPTDLTATSLASCMMTLMGIYANNHGIDLKGTEAEVTKVMTDSPRRISEIHVNLKIVTKNALTNDKKTALERAALTCPVYFSLHPDIKKEIIFFYAD